MYDRSLNSWQPIILVRQKRRFGSLQVKRQNHIGLTLAFQAALHQCIDILPSLRSLS
jgi:hypothetical protein